MVCVYRKHMEEHDILVHACCGPCSTASIERMLEEGWNPVLHFSNSNIFPEQEADKRYEALLEVARVYNLKVIREHYDHQGWLDAVKGHEGEREGQPVIKRAREILKELEETGSQSQFTAASVKNAASATGVQTMSFEDMAKEEVVEMLKSTDINTLTPIEAMNLVFELKKKLSE